MDVIYRRSLVCFGCAYEWWGASCAAHVKLAKTPFPLTTFTIEMINMYIYDFGTKAMLSNAGLYVYSYKCNSLGLKI